jgi:hypothetical protein
MSDEGVSQVTKSQADRQFPKQFVDKKYITASQLKKDDLISRLQVTRPEPQHCTGLGCLQF